eukprot:SAG11_NODE_2077_length_3856_cov_2.082246_4_plen_58_part_00
MDAILTGQGGLTTKQLVRLLATAMPLSFCNPCLWDALQLSLVVAAVIAGTGGGESNL